MRALMSLALLALAAPAVAKPTVLDAVLIHNTPSPVVIVGAAPNAPVALLVSVRLGAPLFCPPQLSPSCSGLGSPGRVLGAATADAAGTAVFFPSAPASISGVNLQAVELAGRTFLFSNVEGALAVPSGGDYDGDDLENGVEVRIGTLVDVADTDGDGLLDGLEVSQYGTSPTSYDTDGGGVNDGEEVARGTDPFYRYDDLGRGGGDDSDGDGLSDDDESNYYGTDPSNADTDGGGVSDGEEVLYQRTDPLYWYDDIDPWTRDSDNDGLYDAEETYVWNTDPWNFDTDFGEVGDGEEVGRGTDPLNGGDDYSYRYQDSDGDLIDDFDETFWYDTDPFNPDTDGDGVWDGTEIAHGTDPNDPNHN
jgi:hypothetical protein